VFHDSYLRFSPLAAMARASSPNDDPAQKLWVIANAVGSGYDDRCIKSLNDSVGWTAGAMTKAVSEGLVGRVGSRTERGERGGIGTDD